MYLIAIQSITVKRRKNYKTVTKKVIYFLEQEPKNKRLKIDKQFCES